MSSECATALREEARRRPAEAAPAVAALRTGLFSEHYDRIFRYVLSLVQDRTEAEDLTQETFLRAHRQREALRDPAAAAAWLYSIATHVSLDRLRQRSRRRSTEARVDPEGVSLSDPAPSAELRVEQNEMSACVRDYVSDLSDSYRAVLMLHDAHGLTCPEIAALLGDSTGSVKIRLHRARKQLQDSLERGCTFSHDECGTLVCEPKGS